MTAQLPSDIPPSELNLLHLVCAIAYSDGELSPEETEFTIDQLSGLFANTETQQQTLRQDLQVYLSQKTPLDDLVAQLSTNEDRELALKLSYMVIQTGKHQEGETPIDKAEKVAYRRLVELLSLPEETVKEIEWAAQQDMKGHSQGIKAIIARFSEFFRR